MRGNCVATELSNRNAVMVAISSWEDVHKLDKYMDTGMCILNIGACLVAGSFCRARVIFTWDTFKDARAVRM